METIVIHRFGAPDVFESADLPVPQAIPGHLVIKVAATSVNPVDCKIRQGKLTAIAPDFPAVLHGDVAGVVQAVGDDVDFAIGEEVFACAGGVKGLGGALSEYMLADARLVAHKPKSLDLHQAAALPLVSITAWEALIERAKVTQGQQVLIHGATGGVSHIAIQLAKWAGATVYAACSSERKADIAKRLGADECIFYKQTNVRDYVKEFTDNRGFDVIFDTVGGDNIAKSFQAAAINGTVVSVSSRSQQDLSPMHAKGLTLHVVFMLIPMLYNMGRERHGAILRQIATLVDEHKLKPLIDEQKFNVTDIALAHKYLESGAAIGKVIVTM
ncbi:MAG: zinc-dependent alcohol dehydrogenase family protein [Gammaproteobacteria bacterium]|jgi:NADPH2:quinone reductase